MRAHASRNKQRAETEHQMHSIPRRRTFILEIGALAAVLLSGVAASAQDKVRVGVFPVSSTLPYFVALERGFFKANNIETEMTRLIGGPPNVAGLITNQIDA